MRNKRHLALCESLNEPNALYRGHGVDRKHLWVNQLGGVGLEGLRPDNHFESTYLIDISLYFSTERLRRMAVITGLYVLKKHGISNYERRSGVMIQVHPQH